MTGRPGTRKARVRGAIDTLRSGSLRVRVYAGIDPVTKKRYDLTEIIPPGPRAQALAEDALDRFRREIAEKRNPRTAATLDQLLTRYLEQFSGSPNTLELYRTHVRNHISPCLGHLKVGQLDAEILDSFYSELRRCRKHCRGVRGAVDHRTAGAHECNEKCRPHRCQPLAPTTIRHIHFILSGAYKRAVRWRWVAANPTGQAEAPPASKPSPQPPSVEEAAVVVNASWRDPDWGALVWLAMTTGARRGELCAVHVSSVVLAAGRETLWLKKAIARDPESGWAEGDLKTHQQRRIALDLETVAVLSEQIERRRARAAGLGLQLRPDAYLFSSSPDGSTFLTPDSVTQRYDRMVGKLGIETTLHKLRHYSATELIAAGVDPRTVAGRLGHGGGGTTTLRTYTAWVSEADQRAASGMTARLPQRPAAQDPVVTRLATPRFPYERVASAVHQEILAGALAPGSQPPTAAELMQTHGVSLATAKRALALMVEFGLLKRTSRSDLRVPIRTAVPAEPAAVEAAPVAEVEQKPMLDFALLCRGAEIYRFCAVADPDDAASLAEVLDSAIVRRGGQEPDRRVFELEVRLAGQIELRRTFAAG